jgi:hypothetical protein
MKKIKISHSGKEKYQSCPRKYYYHYIERLRSPKVGSALFFGNALDDAFSRCLIDKSELDSKALKIDTTLTAEEIFAARMLETKNDAGQIVAIPFSPLADYYTSDFDAALFTNEIVAMVQKAYPSFDTLAKIVAFHDHCKKNLNPRNKQKVRITDDEFILYNYINWLSLNEKGKLMLKAYQQQILPQIAHVYDIQKEISITNEHGDNINGKIDVVASFIDSPDTKYTCDNKTSSKPYSADSVALSDQLAIYGHVENNDNGAYLVTQKVVFKTAPKIRTQIIKGKINKATTEKVLDTFEEVVHNISAAGDNCANFPKNEDSCFAFGKACPYLQICKYGKDVNSTILVKMEKK